MGARVTKLLLSNLLDFYFFMSFSLITIILFNLQRYTYFLNHRPLCIIFPIIFFPSTRPPDPRHIDPHLRRRNLRVDKNILPGCPFLRTFAVKILTIYLNVCTRIFNALCNFLSH